MNVRRNLITPLPRSLLLCILVCPLGCATRPHRAAKAEAEQDWNRVRAEFKMRLADEHISNDRVHEAIKALQRAVSLDPENGAYYLRLARCHLELGDFAAARLAVERAEASSADPAELAYTKGIIAEQLTRQDDMLSHFSEALRLEPHNMEYVLAVTESLVVLGREIEARSLLDAQLLDKPGAVPLLLQRARIFLLLGDLEQAASDFEAAGDLHQGDRWLAEQYGLTLARLGRYAKALAVLQPLLEQQTRTPPEKQVAPPSAMLVCSAAACYNRIGMPQKARILLEEYLDENPSDTRAWLLLAESCIRLNDWPAVQNCVEKGRTLASHLTDWELLEAYIAWRSGDLSQSIALLQSILDAHPDDVLTHCFLALLFERRNDFERVREHYEMALQVDPDNFWARAGLLALSRRGQSNSQPTVR